MEFDIVKLLILCCFIFFAAFVDSIAGGGGVISAPAYLALGFPSHITLGTAKFSGVLSGAVPILRYGKSKKIQWKSAWIAVITCIAGSYLGSLLALQLSERTLQMVMLGVLPFVAAFLILRKNNKDRVVEEAVIITPKMMIQSGVIGFVIGIYEGLLGPGTGTFLIIAFTSILNFDMLTASGTAKVVNYAGTVTAAVTFLFSGKVLLIYALPTALCGMLGSYIGSGLAIKNGDKIIRPLMTLVVVLLFVKIAFDFFNR